MPFDVIQVVHNREFQFDTKVFSALAQDCGLEVPKNIRSRVKRGCQSQYVELTEVPIEPILVILEPFATSKIRVIKVRVRLQVPLSAEELEGHLPKAAAHVKTILAGDQPLVQAGIMCSTPQTPLVQAGITCLTPQRPLASHVKGQRRQIELPLRTAPGLVKELLEKESVPAGEVAKIVSDLQGGLTRGVASFSRQLQTTSGVSVSIFELTVQATEDGNCVVGLNKAEDVVAKRALVSSLPAMQGVCGAQDVAKRALPISLDEMQGVSGQERESTVPDRTLDAFVQENLQARGVPHEQVCKVIADLRASPTGCADFTRELRVDGGNLVQFMRLQVWPDQEGYSKVKISRMQDRLHKEVTNTNTSRVQRVKLLRSSTAHL